MKARPAPTAIRYLLLVAVTAVVLVPFLGIILAALHPADSQVGGVTLPPRFSWENFGIAWNQAQFGSLVGSSFLIAGFVVPLAVVFATLAGYSLQILKAPGHKIITPAFVFGLTLPWNWWLLRCTST